MATTEFNVKIQGLAELQAAFAQAPRVVTPILAQAIHRVPAILAKYTTRENVPYDTGHLIQRFRQSIQGLSAHWFPTVNYAAFVEFGTPPHVIRPVNKKALFWKGAAHPVKKVNHPGTRPNPFMERIRDAATDDINSTFVEALYVIGAALSTKP